VTVHVDRLVGRAEDDRFRERRVVEVPIAWDEASRRRLRRAAADGTDVAIDLANGEYLADGAVLLDDGSRVLVVVRSLERALVVKLDLQLPAAQLISQALLIGHAFGNQHVPAEVHDEEIRIPLLTGEATARATLAKLGFEGLSVSVQDVALARLAPLSIAHPHRHEDD
jgi:urease accessory protein